jgi:hypothetical protein
LRKVAERKDIIEKGMKGRRMEKCKLEANSKVIEPGVAFQRGPPHQLVAEPPFHLERLPSREYCRQLLLFVFGDQAPVLLAFSSSKLMT